MKVREIFNSKLAAIIKADAITLFPFIFYAEASPADHLRRHEWEHVAQIRKLGWLKFYLRYLWEYFCHRLIARWSHYDSYANITFELEAHAVQGDGRRPWEIG